MKRLTLTAFLVFCGMIAGIILTGRMRSAEEIVASAPPAAQNRDTTAPVARATGGPDFTAVAARTVKGVTNISSFQAARGLNTPFANDPFFRYFFGDDPDMFGWQDRRAASLGSGVIVSSDGYILTNNHVVGQHTSQITVVLADKRELRATLVGVDSLTDVALLKIDATGLPTIPWGDSSRLKVAEWVMAIGNPFQLSQTVTLGIVSALGRANVGVAQYEDFVQTDAAINPGNSGGALINARGELVGINTAIYSQSGGYQGVGFAVPSNLARHVMDDIIKYGAVRRGSIGYMEIENVTTHIAEELGAPGTRGALVSRMFRDTAAYRAGIRPGDIIVMFGSQTVEDSSHFLRLLADAQIGTTITLGLIREGRRLEVKVPVSQSTASRRGGR